MDLDGDGRTDVISGSWPGEIYFFRRESEGTFAAGEQLKDRGDKILNVGSASAAFAVDWDGNGTLDLLVGTIVGEVHFIPNEGKGKALAFGAPRKLEVAGQPLQTKGGDAAPVAADWDGDGRHDLIVGAGDGSVVWFRNIGSAREPKLESARTLVNKSRVGSGGDYYREPGEYGTRVKPCVVDWDGDGRLDLLLGDYCGGTTAKPNQTEQEKEEERKANDRLPGLRQKWADAFQRYQKANTPPDGETAAARQQRLKTLDALRGEMNRLTTEIALVQEIQARYRPGYQSHGFVWFFQRNPNLQKGP